MTKDEIICEVTANNEYKNICRRMVGGNNLYKDLYQELLLILLEYPAEKFERIINPNQSKFFIVGILCNMVHSNRSPFHKKYRTTTFLGKEQHIMQSYDEEYDYETDKKIHETEKALNNEHWFDKELLKLYIEHGSYTKIEKYKKIDRSFAYRTLTKLKKRVIEKIKKVKILLITQKEDNALKYHRQISPHVRLMKKYPEEIIVHQKTGTAYSDGKQYEATIDNMTDEELSEYNIIYYLRQISFAQGKVDGTIERCRRLGLSVILDIDDNWILPSMHIMHERYMEQNVRDETEKALQMVDHVICTTENFAAIIRPFNSNISVFPNCINSDDEQFMPRHIESPRIRFGWIGGIYHKHDIESMGATFCKLSKDKELRDKYQICLGGYNIIQENNKIILNKEYDAIEKIMTCNYDFRFTDATYMEYLFNYTQASEHISLDKNYRRLWAKPVTNYGELYNEIDVALVPLIPNKFNGCKSELKIVEAGWMKKAVIVQDTLPYNKWIKHKKNGLLINPNRSIDWYLSIKKLVSEPNLRHDMAEALHETITENFNMDKHNENRLQLYKSLVN